MAWLQTVGDRLYDKLVRVGLLMPRLKSTIGEYVDKVIEEREEDLKPTSLRIFRLTRGHLVEFFGAMAH